MMRYRRAVPSWATIRPWTGGTRARSPGGRGRPVVHRGGLAVNSLPTRPDEHAQMPRARDRARALAVIGRELQLLPHGHPGGFAIADGTLSRRSADRALVLAE